jgi:hypothetical protein
MQIIFYGNLCEIGMHYFKMLVEHLPGINGAKAKIISRALIFLCFGPAKTTVLPIRME